MSSGLSTYQRALIVAGTAVAAVLVLTLVLAVAGGGLAVALPSGAVCALLVGLLAWSVGRAAERTGAEMAAVAECLAAGDFAAAIPQGFGGQEGKLFDGLAKVQASSASLVAELGHMSAEHEKGDIDVFINPASFVGGFKALAEGVNLMVGTHISVKKKAMAVFKAFGEGNFEADMEQLPGKKAFINETIESVRGNLKALVDEMVHMSAEHEKGDIDVTINSTRFVGGFKAMAEGINLMVGSHISVKKKAMAVFKAFGEGNFEADMEKLPGKKAFINDTIESVRGNLKGLVAEMNRMSSEHEKGDIDVTIDTAQFAGGFKAMAEGVNLMVA